jgi:hypothetical protein
MAVSAKKKNKKKPAAPVFKKTTEPFKSPDYTATPTYRKNLAALREYYPDLAERVARCSITGRYRLEASAKGDGTPNLYCVEGGFYYYDHGDPLLDVRQRLDRLTLRNAKLGLCLGVGLGYQLTYFTDHLAQRVNSQALIVIEKDLELFKLACCFTDFSELVANPRLLFLVGVEEQQLYVPLKNTIKDRQWFMLLLTLKPFYHPTSLLLNKEYYLAAIRTVNQAASHTVLDFGNCPEDSLIGIENMLANLPLIIRSPGIDRLYGTFKGKPAIVAATGPSLNKNKHLLKGVGDKALLLCPDASLPILLAMGVRPHLVTSLERGIPGIRFFEEIPAEQLTDTYLAACPVIRKELYDVYQGPKVIVYRNLDHFKWLEIERGILDIKASSGNMAFKIAAAMGCDPIILVGQDLAFERDGTTHAAGSIFGENQDILDDLFVVPGNTGEPVPTNPTFFSFLKGYEVDVAEYKGTCVNSTEGGAFIQGTLIMPLAAAIDKYIGEVFNPLDILRNHLTSPDEATTQKTVAQVVANIDHTAGELAKIAILCQKGLAYLDKVAPDLKVAQLSQAQSILKETLTLKDKCRADHHTFQLFFTHVIQSFAIRFEMSIQTIPDTHPEPVATMAETALRHREWFEGVGRLAGVCQETLHKYRELLYFDFLYFDFI